MRSLPDCEFISPRPSGWLNRYPTFLYRCVKGHEHRFLLEQEDAVCMFTHWGTPCLEPLEKVEQ